VVREGVAEGRAAPSFWGRAGVEDVLAELVAEESAVWGGLWEGVGRWGTEALRLWDDGWRDLPLLSVVALLGAVGCACSRFGGWPCGSGDRGCEGCFDRLSAARFRSVSGAMALVFPCPLAVAFAKGRYASSSSSSSSWSPASRVSMLLNRDTGRLNI